MFIVAKTRLPFASLSPTQSIVLNTLPLAYNKNSIDLETRQAEDRPEEEDKRVEFGRRENQRFKVIKSQR